MNTFTDSVGRSWLLRVDVNSIRRVRELAGVDLNGILNNNTLLIELAQDACRLVNVLYVLAKEQCDQKGVSDEQFGEALYGDAIDAAAEAFLKAIIDFFPSRRQKSLLQALEAAKKGQAIALNKLDEAINKGLMDRIMNKEVARVEEILAKAWSS